jgi:hypothetical protein
MPKRDKLFLLVKSLTKSEKRYFSIYTKMHIKGEDNDYMKLFKAFEKQDTLNENEIRQWLQGEKLMEHYAVTKSYLYDLILKAMRSYSKHSAEKKVMDLLQDVEFLYTKGIFDQALQLSRKARELAGESGLVAAMDLILHWEKLIHLATGFSLIKEERLDSIAEQQDKVQSNREELHHLWLLCANMALRQRKGLLSRGNINTQMEERIAMPPTPIDPELNNYRVYFLDLYARALHTSFGANAEESLVWIQRITTFMESEGDRWLRHPYLYSRALTDRLELEVDLNHLEAAKQTLEYIQTTQRFKDLNSYFDAWRQVVTVFGRILIHFHHDAASEGIRFQTDVRNVLKKFAPFINPLRELEFQFLLGYFCYRVEDWEQAEEYFNDVVYEADETTPTHLITAAWMLRILALMQVDNRKRALRVAERFLNFLEEGKDLSEQEKGFVSVAKFLTNHSGTGSMSEDFNLFLRKNKNSLNVLPIHVGNRRYFNRMIQLVQNNPL